MELHETRYRNYMRFLWDALRNPMEHLWKACEVKGPSPLKRSLRAREKARRAYLKGALGTLKDEIGVMGAIEDAEISAATTIRLTK